MKNGRTDVLKQASKRKKECRQDHPGRAFERVLAKRKGGAMPAQPGPLDQVQHVGITAPPSFPFQSPLGRVL